MGRQDASHCESGGAESNLSSCCDGVGGSSKARDKRNVGDPRDRAHCPAEPSQRDVEESTNDDGIELIPRAARQFRAGSLRAKGLFVRAA